MGAGGKGPARATEPRCRGDHPVLPYPIDRRLRLCARVGTQHLFIVVRCRSCVVPGVRRRCVWRQCYTCARGACGVQGGVLARGAALWLRLLLQRRVRCGARDVGRACRGKCARGGCVRGARAGCRGVGLASCHIFGRGVASLLGRRACAPPVPVLVMSLMPLRVVGAVVAAVPLLFVVRAHGVAGGPRGTAARGAAAVLAWRWR